MAKKSGLGNLLLLGGVAIGGYLLYKTFFGGQQPLQGSGYSMGWVPGDTTPTTPMNQDENTPTVKPSEPVLKPFVPVLTPTQGANPIITVTPGTGDITVTPIQTPIQKPLIQYQVQQPSGIQSIITIPAPLGVTPATVAANQTQQSWTAATYGQPGQPSVSFLQNTLTTAASNPTMTQQVRTSIAPTRTVSTTTTAAAAIAAGAPPRVVAKIKAGSWY